MYKRIMVPLDGSTTAEMSLPYTIELAAHFDSEITLFSVNETGAIVTESLFRSYLDVVAAELRSDMQTLGRSEPVIRIQIATGNPAAEILRSVDNGNIDLIIMASRGATVDSEWALGNIAAKVVRIAPKPVMLIKHQIHKDLVYQKRLVNKILVPLDGSRVGEAAIPHAEAIGKMLGAELVAFHATEPAPWPITNELITKARDENNLKAASVYLDRVVGEMRNRGLTITSHLVTGYPAEEILKYVEAKGINLIAIATHGRSGVGRWAIGSVTDKLLYAGNTPLLVEHSKS